MAETPRYLRRPTAILLMPDAMARGLTVTAFIKELQNKGLSYMRQRMLADWRNVAGTEARKDTYKYIRKDLRISPKLLADVDWEMSKEYMYKYKVLVRTREGEPLSERFVNIVHDRLLTPRELETELRSRWADWEKYQPESIEKLELIGAWHRVEYLEEPSESPFETE